MSVQFNCECLLPVDFIDMLTHEQHVAFHTHDVDVQAEAFESLATQGADEDRLDEIAGTLGFLCN